MPRWNSVPRGDDCHLRLKRSKCNTFEMQNVRNAQRSKCKTFEMLHSQDKICFPTPGAYAKKTSKIFSPTPGAYARKNVNNISPLLPWRTLENTPKIFPPTPGAYDGVRTSKSRSRSRTLLRLRPLSRMLQK